jgi:peptidoglycan biosynthesis protein MviN/MurJ (putative lipid II flippase)
VNTEEWLQADLWQRITNLAFWIVMAMVMYFSVLALVGMRPRHLMQKSVLDMESSEQLSSSQ